MHMHMHADCQEDYAGGILWSETARNEVAFAPCRDADSHFRSELMFEMQQFTADHVCTH